MKLVIRAGGIIRACPERDLIDEYIKRANGLTARSGFLALAEEEIDLKKCRNRSEATEKIFSGIGTTSKLIILDEKGKGQTSRDISKSLLSAQQDGIAAFILAIGGADGFDPQLIPGHAQKWSFGPQTWPHKLVRVMAAEQMYRALSILAGSPYHRD